MPDYNVDGLQAGIENCNRNIQVFKDAIKKEENTIREYHFYIQEILRKKKLAEEQEKQNNAN